MIVAAIVDAIDIDITVIVIDITVITIVEGLVLSRSRLSCWFLGNAKLTSTPTKLARYQSQITN
jgi:pheromone shutdown protein TraB